MPERRNTFLLYLNDLYPSGAGGGLTSFPALNVSVELRRGRALSWTNHHATDGAPDERLVHESVGVASGVKYCMNIWVRRHAPSA